MANPLQSVFNLIPARVVFTLFGCLGILNIYMLRVNLSVAMVSMVNTSAILAHNDTGAGGGCARDDNNANSSDSSQHDGEFVWNESIQSLVLGAFFWGYMVTQLPGGRIAEVSSAKWTIGLGVLASGVFALLTPVAARGAGHWGLIVVRVLQGLGQGVVFPALHVMISQWSPPSERSRTVTIIFSGGLIGTVIGISLSGVVAAHLGWPFVFYIFGACGIIWFVFWMLLAFDSPGVHPWIGAEERDFIENSLKETMSKNKKKASPPWLKVAKSLPMWAIVVAHFCQNWGFYTLLTELPTYLSRILQMDMKEKSFLSALPYLMSWVFSFISGNVCDLLLKKKVVSTTVARKLFHGFGQILPAAFIFAITQAGCDTDLAFAFLIVAMTFNGAVYSGYTCSHIDIAPNYAGTLMGLTNTIATIPGFLGPAVVGAFTDGQSTREQWSKVFYISSAIYVFSAVFYGVFITGEEQPWNKIEENKQSSETEESGKSTNVEKY